MPNTTLQASAVCPFFLNDYPLSIVCEGIYGETTRTNFKNSAFKNVHAKEYCTTNNCRFCEIYRGNMKKYER